MDVSCAEIEQYLHEHIPMSKAMAVVVEAIAETGVTLSAPLAPNINHRHTAFGGSISTLAILSAWTAVHVGLLREQVPCRIVIQRNSVEYLGPIEGDFQARWLSPTPVDAGPEVKPPCSIALALSDPVTPSGPMFSGCVATMLARPAIVSTTGI